MEDVIGEILLRLPPEDPACLLRASLVCKSWHRFLSDGVFVHQYCTFHRTPPMLCYFQDLYSNGTRVPQYIPTIKASPVPQPTITVASSPTTCCDIVDCRHGRVLFQAKNQSSLRFIVWDPVSGKQKSISTLLAHPYTEFSATVMCAVDGCDHLGCSGGPFLVVGVGIYDKEDVDHDKFGDADGDYMAWASLYPSESGEWRASTSISVDYIIEVILPSLLTRDAIYFILECGERILKYGLVGGVLSVIKAPPQYGSNMIFATEQGGELGAAIVQGYNLHLWSWQSADLNDVTGEWIRCRVIELDAMTPMSIGDPSTMFELVGFAEGTGTIFISANDDLFTIKFNTGQITKTAREQVTAPFFLL